VGTRAAGDDTARDDATADEGVDAADSDPARAGAGAEEDPVDDLVPLDH
jgi:hypothetical protein